MNPSVSYPFSLLLLSSFFPSHADDQGNRFPRCQPFDCGKFKQISYPFRERNQPNYCGHPVFVLDCESNPDPSVEHIVPEFSHPRNQPECSNLHDCPNRFLGSFNMSQKFSNTTLNSTLFHYTPKEETPKSSTDLSSFQYCSVSNVSLKTFFVPGTDLGSYELAWPVCNLSVVVPVREEAIKDYPVDARKIIETGCEVEWTSIFEKERKDCVDSGGICGNDNEAGAGNEFMCLCPRDQETSDHGLKLCETSDHEQPPTSRPENALSGKFIKWRRHMNVNQM